MLFRPTYCAQCGERIERVEWYPWTTRRFCQVCESQYKGQDMIPRAVMLLCVLIGVFGIGSYLKSGPTTDLRARNEPQRFAERQNAAPPVTALRSQMPANNVAPTIPEVQSQPQPIAAPAAPTYHYPRQSREWNARRPYTTAVRRQRKARHVHEE